jgi:hypothetical protein
VDTPPRAGRRRALGRVALISNTRATARRQPQRSHRMRHRVSAAMAVRAGSALLQGMQAILLLTLLPWLDTYDYYNYDADAHDLHPPGLLPPLDGVEGNRTNDAYLDPDTNDNTNNNFSTEPFDAQRLIIAVLALGAVCPGIGFAWRAPPSSAASARWWGRPPQLLQWIECSAACPLTLLALAVELGVRPPRDAYLLEALVALAWCVLLVGLKRAAWALSHTPSPTGSRPSWASRATACSAARWRAWSAASPFAPPAPSARHARGWCPIARAPWPRSCASACSTPRRRPPPTRPGCGACSGARRSSVPRSARWVLLLLCVGVVALSLSATPCYTLLLPH